jgi:hypothetical protein
VIHQHGEPLRDAWGKLVSGLNFQQQFFDDAMKKPEKTALSCLRLRTCVQMKDFFQTFWSLNGFID